MDDDFEALTSDLEAHIDAEQYAAEVEAQKAANVQAAYDVQLYRTYRVNGLGRIASTLLTAIHAARD